MAVQTLVLLSSSNALGEGVSTMSADWRELPAADSTHCEMVRYDPMEGGGEEGAKVHNEMVFVHALERERQGLNTHSIQLHPYTHHQLHIRHEVGILMTRHESWTALTSTRTFKT